MTQYLLIQIGKIQAIKFSDKMLKKDELFVNSKLTLEDINVGLVCENKNKKSLLDQQVKETVRVLDIEKKVEIEVKFAFQRQELVFNLDNKMNQMGVFVTPQLIRFLMVVLQQFFNFDNGKLLNHDDWS